MGMEHFQILLVPDTPLLRAGAPSSNNSLERAVLAPRAVPAVPLIGCTSVPSTNGRFAAAHFYRQTP